MGTGDTLLRGFPVMDYHTIQGGVAILLSMLHTKEIEMRSGCSCRPLARVRLYLLNLLTNGDPFTISPSSDSFKTRPGIIMYWSFVNEFHSIILLFLKVLKDGN